MKTFISLRAGLFDELHYHLLPKGDTREQAAFLFAHPGERGLELDLKVADFYLAMPKDFAAQYENYLELTDDARARLIKKAHRLGASLIEMHSHPRPIPAEFSYSDEQGLSETVPHIWWRLKGRPYAAVVVSPGDFDALIWHSNPHQPQALTGIKDGVRLRTPTNLTISNWENSFNG